MYGCRAEDKIPSIQAGNYKSFAPELNPLALACFFEWHALDIVGCVLAPGVRLHQGPSFVLQVEHEVPS